MAVEVFRRYCVMTISGYVRACARGELVVQGTGEGCGEQWQIWNGWENSGSLGFNIDGASFNISASLDETHTDYMYVNWDWSLSAPGASLSGSVPRVAGSMLDMWMERCPGIEHWMHGDYESFVTCSLMVYGWFRFMFELQAPPHAAVPCYCQDETGQSQNDPMHGSDEAFCSYREHDPCWVPNLKGFYWYEPDPALGLTVACSIDGGGGGSTVVGPADYGGDSAAFVAAWRNCGLMQATLGRGAVASYLSEQYGGVGRLAYATFARAGLTNNSNFGNKVYNYHFHDNDTDNNYTWPVVYLSGNRIDLFDNGGWWLGEEGLGPSCSFTLTDHVGPFTSSHAPVCKYTDGSDTVTVAHWSVDECTPEWNEEANGWENIPPRDRATTFTGDTVISYQGYWHLTGSVETWWRGNPPEIPDPNLPEAGMEGPYSTADAQGWYAEVCHVTGDRFHGRPWIENVSGMGEPSFPDTDEVVNCDNHYKDERTLLRPKGDLKNGDFDWSAMTVDVQETQSVKNFSNTGWTASGVTIDNNVNNGIRFTVDSEGAYISQTFTDFSMQGARFADVGLVTDSAQECRVTIAGRQFMIGNNDANEIDMLAPVNQTGTGTTRSVIPTYYPYGPVGEQSDDPPWDWGIHVPHEIKFDQLEVGKTYLVTGIILKRKGDFRVVTRPQARWTGNVANGQFSMDGWELAGMSEVGLPEDESYRMIEDWLLPVGVIIVDGVIAGEIVGVHAIKTVWPNTYTGTVWTFSLPSVTDTDMRCFPPCDNGMVTISTTVAGTEDMGFKELAFLKPVDVSSASNPIGLDAEIVYDYVMVAPRWPSVSFDDLKTFRGESLLVVVDENGTYKGWNVHIDAGSGANLTNQNITTDTYGVVLSPPVNQLQGLHAKSLDYDGAGTLETDITIRNRMVSRALLKGPMVGEPVEGSGLHTVDSVTGRIYRAVGQNGDIWVGCSDDFGNNWTGRIVTTDHDCAEPRLAWEWRTAHPKLWLYYYKPNASKIVRRYSTNEGATFSSEVDVVAASHPYVMIDRETGMMWLYYYDGGQIYCKRSMDCGANWLESAFVVVSSASNPADDSISAEVTHEATHRVMLTYRDTSNVIHTVLSQANGLAPYA